MSDTPRPKCENHDPELWYPELSVNVNQHSEKGQKQIKRAITALMICETCPLLANGKCAEYTFKSLDSIRYGISAGLLPNEKRTMIGFSMSDISEPFFKTIRRQATAQGIPTPPQPKREKPRPLYALNDNETLGKRNAERRAQQD